VRGEQFAIALSLLDHGRPVVGLLGCPNLPPRLPDASLLGQSNGHVLKPDDGVGSLFWASEQQGAYACSLADGGTSAIARAPPVALLGSSARLSVNPEESMDKLVGDPPVGVSMRKRLELRATVQCIFLVKFFLTSTSCSVLSFFSVFSFTCSFLAIQLRSESAEPGHSAHGDAAAAATALNMNKPPIRMDGQGKVRS